jgi:hypothetical protein
MATASLRAYHARNGTNWHEKPRAFEPEKCATAPIGSGPDDGGPPVASREDLESSAPPRLVNRNDSEDHSPITPTGPSRRRVAHFGAPMDTCRCATIGRVGGMPGAEMRMTVAGAMEFTRTSIGITHGE